MRTVLINDIEIDIRELKLLLDAVEKDPGTPLRNVAERRILQIQKNLSELSDSLTKNDLKEIIVPQEQKQKIIIRKEQTEEELIGTSQPEISETPSILAESLKISGNLLHAFSINDSFLFSRELFKGDTDSMNSTLQKIEKMESLENAISYLTENELADKENESFDDFIEILDKYFSTKQK